MQLVRLDEQSPFDVRGSSTHVLTTMSNSKSKSSEAKELRSAAKKAARKDLLFNSPGSYAAQGMAKTVGSIAKKKAKKGNGWWGLLAGAAKMAADLAPVLGPMLLAQHAPSARLAASRGAAQSAAPAGPPLAQANSCSLCVGTYSMRPKNGPDGRVNSIRVRGMDYLGTLDITAGFAAGDLINEVDLNPASAAWAGTTLQRQMSLYERYHLIQVACIVEPSCAATQAGQIISFVDPDPDDLWTHRGRTAIQVASATQGADVSQVWGMNCAGYTADPRTQDYYVDAAGSDARLTSPGTWRILAATDLSASGGVPSIGTLYVVWEYDLVQPQIEDNIDGGRFAFLEADGTTGQNGANIMGSSADPDNSWPNLQTEGNMLGILGSDGTYQYFYALPAGTYLVVFEVAGTGLASPSTDTDAVNYVSTYAQGIVNAGGTVAFSVDFFTVNAQTNTQAAGYLSYTITATTVTNAQVSFVSYPAGVSLAKKKTLQEYETQIEGMNKSLISLHTQMTALSAALTTPAAASAPDPSGQFAAMLRQLSLPQVVGTTTHQ